MYHLSLNTELKTVHKLNDTLQIPYTNQFNHIQTVTGTNTTDLSNTVFTQI